MTLAYLEEIWGNGEIRNFLPDYEFNDLVYEPRNSYEASPEGKALAKVECYFIRTMENRWARPVKMIDGLWVAYASYLTKDGD